MNNELLSAENFDDEKDDSDMNFNQEFLDGCLNDFNRKPNP